MIDFFELLEKTAYYNAPTEPLVGDYIKRPELDEDAEDDLLTVLISEREYNKDLRFFIHNMARHIVYLHKKYKKCIELGRKQVQEDIDASEELLEQVRKIINKG